MEDTQRMSCGTGHGPGRPFLDLLGLTARQGRSILVGVQRSRGCRGRRPARQQLTARDRERAVHITSRQTDNLELALGGLADALGIPLVLCRRDGTALGKWQKPEDAAEDDQDPPVFPMTGVSFSDQVAAVFSVGDVARFAVRFATPSGVELFVQSADIPEEYPWVGRRVKSQIVPGFPFPMDEPSEFLLGLVLSAICLVVADERSGERASPLTDVDVENIRRIALSLRTKIGAARGPNEPGPFSLAAVPRLDELFSASSASRPSSVQLETVFKLVTTGTGSSFNLMGLSGDFVTHASTFQDACGGHIRQQLGARCFASDVSCLIEAALRGEVREGIPAALRRVCHAGFTEIFAPVFVHGLVVGLVFGGQVIEDEGSRKRILAQLATLGADASALRPPLEVHAPGVANRTHKIVTGLSALIGLLIERYCMVRSEAGLRETLVGLETGDLRRILRQACIAMKRYLMVSECSAFRLDGQNLILEATTAKKMGVRAKAGDRPSIIAAADAIGKPFYRLGEGLTGTTAAKRKLRFERNAPAAHDWAGKCTEVLVTQSQSVVAPVMHGERCYGVLRGARSSGFIPIPEDHLRLLEGFARELGMVLAYHELVIEESRGFREKAAALQHMLAQAAHEFKAPLHNILQLCTGLRHTSPLMTWEVDKLHQGIKEEAARAKRHLDNYLLVGVAGREEVAYDLQTNNLGNLISECASRFQRTAMRRKIQILVDDSVTRLPDTVFDYDRMEQVVMNLLDNGIKYSFDREPLVIRATDHKGTVTFSVTDRGLGIPMQARETIFRGYQRVVEDKRRFKPGTGVGLMIAKQIVDRHEGQIQVESTPFLDDPKRLADLEGFETTFIVALPKTGPSRERTGDLDHKESTR